MSGKDLFLEQNPDVVQLPSLFNHSASGTGDRVKTDNGWKENYQGLQKHTPILHWVINIIRKQLKNYRPDES